jgi:hypothetical protein
LTVRVITQSFGACEKVIDMTLTLPGPPDRPHVLKLSSQARRDQLSLPPQYYSFLNATDVAQRDVFCTPPLPVIFMEDSSCQVQHLFFCGSTSAADLSGGRSTRPQAPTRPPPHSSRQNVPAATVTGRFRDLMGISNATMCPARAHLTLSVYSGDRAFVPQAWSRYPHRSTSLLKFMLEFVSSRAIFC